MASVKKLLLIVEDTFYRELIRNRFLRTQEWAVETVSGAGTLPDFVNAAPDAIVLDETISGATVETMLSVLQLNVPSCPVVVLTDDPSTNRRKELTLQGAYDTVPKDENTLDLLDHVVRRSVVTTTSEKGYSITGHQVAVPAYSSSPSRESERTLEEYTMEIIQQFLARYDNNVVLVARKLGVGKSTIYRYLKEKKLTITGSSRIRRPEEASLPVNTSNSGGFVLRGSPSTSGVTAPEVSADTLVDLDYLMNVYGGDRKSVAGMIDVFLQTMDRHIAQLKQFQSESDFDKLHGSLQEMKPVVEYMGMHGLKAQVVQTKMMVENRMDWNAINNSLSEVYSLYGRCVDQLNRERSRLV
jgi:ActR/RegA family two-component response regulator